MLDDAVMTLGEKTIFVVIDYVTGGVEPNAAMRLLQGAFSGITGKMIKTSGAQFTVETEAGTHTTESLGGCQTQPRHCHGGFLGE